MSLYRSAVAVKSNKTVTGQGRQRRVLASAKINTRYYFPLKGNSNTC